MDVGSCAVQDTLRACTHRDTNVENVANFDKLQILVVPRHKQTSHKEMILAVLPTDSNDALVYASLLHV